MTFIFKLKKVSCIIFLILYTYYLGPVSLWHFKCDDNPNPNPRLKAF